MMTGAAIRPSCSIRGLLAAWILVLGSSPMYVHAHAGGMESHSHRQGRIGSPSPNSLVVHSTHSHDRHCHVVLLGIELVPIPAPSGSSLPDRESAALGSVWTFGHVTIKALLSSDWLADLQSVLTLPSRSEQNLLIASCSPRSLADSPPHSLCDCALLARSGVLLV
jgi:hypothetical protein